MSPVCAPAGSAWQSWPPIITDEPCAEAANSRIKVARGHTINSALPLSSAAPDRILANSARDAANPFIFQLPATSGIELPAAIEIPLRVRYQTRPGNASAALQELIPLELQRVGSVTMVPPPCLS